jgi:uncharacterized protein (TIGR02145 family)
MKIIIQILSFLFFALIGMAQNVGIGTSTPNPSAVLDLSSSTKGFLPPRLTLVQRDEILNPSEGLQIWNSDCKEIQVFNGTIWTNMIGGVACLGNNIPNVIICNQRWFLKNLDVSKYKNGDPIPQVDDATAWSKLTTGAWCWYNNDSTTYASTYGKLYNWYAVNDSRGLAPQGWHIATDAEWSQLSTCLGGDAVAGGNLKETGISNWFAPNNGANNSSGFTGLGAGFRTGGGLFTDFGFSGVFWCSTESDINYAWIRKLNYSNINLFRSDYRKTHALSVRCIRD